MAIGRISGQMLKANLLRSGVDLAFETNLLVLDVTNSYVGIGTATPSRQLHVSGTGALRLPSGTDAQRGTSANGDIRYNTDQGFIEGYSNGTWKNLTDQGIDAVVQDPAPQLGGDLDVQSQSIITSVTNGDINITPNGTGNVNLNADTIRVGDSSGDITITTNDAVDLILSTNNGTNSGTITIQDGANQNIAIAPNGTGDVFLQTDTVKVGVPNNAASITTNGTGNLTLDTNAGTNSGSIVINQGANADINLTPNGTGTVNITKANIDAGTIDGTTIGGSSAAAGTFTTMTAPTIVTNEISSADSTAIQINDGLNINGTATANTFNSSNATITGGTINNTAIGGSTPAAGSFTNLTGNGTISITGTTTGNINNVTIGGTTRAAGYFTTVDTSGNVTVGGNLTVNGTTTTIESSTLTIEDPLIILAKNNSGGAGNTYDQGLLFNRGSLSNVSFLWDESADEFVVANTASETGNTAGNVTIDSYATFRAGTVNGTSLATDGITIGTNNISATRSNDDLVLSGSGTGVVRLTTASLGATTMTANLALGGNDITGVDDVGTTSVTATGTVSAGTLSSSGVSITQNNIYATRSNDDLVLSPAGGGFVIVTGQAKLPATVMQGSLEMGNFNITGANSITASTLTNGRIEFFQNEIRATTTNDDLVLVGSGTGRVRINSVDINGGSINGTPIGGILRDNGNFVAVNSTNGVDIESDNANLRIGAGQDLRLYHDGTNSYINNFTGELRINGFATSKIAINQNAADVDTQISGDTVTNLLYVDASADKIGIGTSTPAYILDTGSITTAIRLPNGTTAERPAAATGVIRFNTQTGYYEGSQDGSTWIQFTMGTGSTVAINKVTATGDGSTSTFNGFFSAAPASANNVMVYIDNVYQEPTENYTVSSNNITFTSAPHSGARIFAIEGFDNSAVQTGGVARTLTESVSFESSATTIMSFNATNYRSAELYVQVTDAANSEYSCMKAHVIHNGTTAYINTYGIVNTGGSDSVTLSATYTAGTVNVQAISTGGTSSAIVQYSLAAV